MSNSFISVVDSTTLASFLVSSGIPQDSVLSPVYFFFSSQMTFIHLQMFSPFSMTQPYTNLLPSSASLPPMLVLSLDLLYLWTINLDLQSIFDWGVHNLVKFNNSKTQLLTVSPSNTHSNYPILFEDSEILPLNSVNSSGLQISIPPACLG